MDLIFDIGRTKSRVAVSKDRKTFGEPKIVDTPKEAAEVLVMLKQAADELSAGEKIDAVCGGLSRKLFLDETELKKIFDCPVYLENDSALCGLGEATNGAGQGSKIMVYYTISTGVGGARIVDGRIDRNTSGFEPGAQIIDLNEPEKQFEDYIRGPALQQKFSLPPHDIIDPQIWDDTAKIFAVGLHNTILHWSPDTVVLGGSMMKVPGLTIPDITRHLQAVMKTFPTLPVIKKADLGDVGGLHGALAHLNSQLKPNS